MGKTPLRDAVSNGNTQIVNALLKHGADVNTQDQLGKTPLHSAAVMKRTGIIKALIKAGANIDAQDTDGKTPLYFAAHEGHIDIVNVLLKNKADVNAKDANGYTPLYHAVCSGQNGQDTIKYLLLAGADTSSKNLESNTLIDLGNYDIKQFIREAAAEVREMKNEKIGTINEKDVSLYEFLKADIKLLSSYYADSNMRSNISKNLSKKPLYSGIMKDRLKAGEELNKKNWEKNL